MTKEEFIEIFETVDSELFKIDGDNCYLGMQIVAKYTNNIIAGADHDVVYSESLDALIDAGITKEDVTELSRLNWSIEECDYLFCFV